MLMDAKHMLAQNPLQPAYRPGRASTAGTAAGQLARAFEGGLVEIGHDGRRLCFRQ